MNLRGNWNLLLDEKKQGIEKQFFSADFASIFTESNSNQIKTIDLPGTVSQQKKSPKTTERAIGYLTDPYKFEGWAWFQKTVNISEEFASCNEVELLLERTRVTTVWVDGQLAGTCNSLNGMHIYKFAKPAANQFTITVLVSNVDYPVGGGHLTSPDTQTNWLGITGRLELNPVIDIRLEKTRLTTLNLTPLTLEISTELTGSKKTSGQITIYETVQNSKGQLEQGKEAFNCVMNLTEGTNKLCCQLPEQIELWSDTNPELYQVEIKLESGFTQTFTTGFRQITTKGTELLVNNQKIFLRGKHDGMIFPETGFAPTSVEEWLKVMKTAQDYGINHYRFHTCCPPEAAFAAADQLGIYMAPELPFWGTIQAPEEEGFNKEQQEYLINEGYKILDCFGNHPSFVMMSMGNELWGSEKRLDDIMKAYNQYDNRHLYTGGSNNFQFWPRTTEHEDYFVGVRFSQDSLIRGSYAQCDAPLGFVQTDMPNTNHNYDVFFTNSQTQAQGNGEEKEIEIQFGTGVKKVKAGGDAAHFIPNKPCISHEVGQYCMYPNYEENQRFTGVLKPYNFEEFQNRLKQAGMENQASQFFRDSSRLAVQCYKTEIEAALRSNELSGFQLLDIQDFTGQGTAVVGVLNAFMESKGIVSGEQWRSFCDQTVLLASFDTYLWQQDQELSADLILHNYSKFDFGGSFMTAYIINTQNDEILCEEQFLIPKKSDSNNTANTAGFRGNTKLGTFKYKFEDVKEYQKLCLLLVLNPEQDDAPESIINSYTLHVYPKPQEQIVCALKQLAEKDEVEIQGIKLKKVAAKDLEKTASECDQNTILLPVDFESQENIKTVPGTYCTDFWCYPMFRSISESMKKPVPVGTLGLTIDTNAKEIEGFPTDTYTTPKWYNLISHATCVKLDSDEKVIVQMIDNFERNWKLGLLYKKNNTLVCTSRLWEIPEQPEVSLFVKSLINYLS